MTVLYVLKESIHLGQSTREETQLQRKGLGVWDGSFTTENAET